MAMTIKIREAKEDEKIEGNARTFTMEDDPDNAFFLMLEPGDWIVEIEGETSALWVAPGIFAVHRTKWEGDVMMFPPSLSNGGCVKKIN